MIAVMWYSIGGHLTEEEMEDEARQKHEAKQLRRGKMIRIFK